MVSTKVFSHNIKYPLLNKQQSNLKFREKIFQGCVGKVLTMHKTTHKQNKWIQISAGKICENTIFQMSLPHLRAVSFFFFFFRKYKHILVENDVLNGFLLQDNDQENVLGTLKSQIISNMHRIQHQKLNNHVELLTFTCSV